MIKEKMTKGKLEQILENAIVVQTNSEKKILDYNDTNKISNFLIGRNIVYRETKRYYCIGLDVKKFTYFSVKSRK